MSWLFKPPGDDPEPPSSSETAGHGVGVKEDITSLGQTISRQLSGVAAFLAPPPSPPSNPVDNKRLSSDSPTQLALVGIRNDLAELGGNLKTGLSNFASNLLQFPCTNNYQGDSDRPSRFDGLDKVPGISEQVVDFAIKISSKPGCWIDFPLSLNIEFELSEAQRAHASAIETLVPSLVAVKHEVSTCMADEHFWLIYFILLMPRLSGHEFELLATSKVFETRDQLLTKLQKKETSGSVSGQGTREEVTNRETETAEVVIESIEALKMEDSDESSCEERRRDEEEIISLSDLDVDELSEKPCSNRSSSSAMKRRASNASSSSDWVQLKRSQGKDSEGESSSDWLPVGDSD